jgi:hypothetical protein
MSGSDCPARPRSEHDCVIHFARFLNEVGVAWEDQHHQVSRSRWLFDDRHPAASTKWRVDLALMRSEDLRSAKLPATDPAFRFDAFLEFTHIADSWKLPEAVTWGEPAKKRKKVRKDLKKIANYVESGVCEVGYAIVFADADAEFPVDFAAEALTTPGCNLRVIKGYT